MNDFEQDINRVFEIEQDEDDVLDQKDVKRIKKASEDLGIDEEVIESITNNQETPYGTDLIIQPENVPDVYGRDFESNEQKRLDKDLFEDYGEVRKNIKKLAKIGENAVDLVLMQIEEVGITTPDNYEVLALLIKNTALANSKLIETHRQMRDITGLTKRAQMVGKNETNIDKAVFVGSSADLNKLLAGKIE